MISRSNSNDAFERHGSGNDMSDIGGPMLDEKMKKIDKIQNDIDFDNVLKEKVEKVQLKINKEVGLVYTLISWTIHTVTFFFIFVIPIF